VGAGTGRISPDETSRESQKPREIDLMIRIIADFEMQVQSFKELYQDNWEASRQFFPRLTSKPEWYGMEDLRSLSVTEWPTFEIYAQFKRYWNVSGEFMATNYDVNKAETYVNLERTHDDSITRVTAQRSKRLNLESVLHFRWRTSLCDGSSMVALPDCFDDGSRAVVRG
jgi:hypothetical protein